MNSHKTGCLICGKELVYFNPAITLKCEKCGAQVEANAACQDRHFVCDLCHSQAGFDSITEYAISSISDNPLAMAREMMRGDFINMHGPEHHYLIVAALLCAYKNAGGKIDLPKALINARQRAQKVPGGICGMWGCCGAAIGSGIFISLATGATPLSVEQWQLANKMTAQSLDVIAQNGGPRCCKRNTWLAIQEAVKFTRQHLGINMEEDIYPQCLFFQNNQTCRKAACPFYPKGAAAVSLNLG